MKMPRSFVLTRLKPQIENISAHPTHAAIFAAQILELISTLESRRMGDTCSSFSKLTSIEDENICCLPLVAQ